ncbi:hypothetical protein KHM83_02890 [Fusibacter paucivorans]|uniref:Uncharacterized protein n=1 Tax=Fusibacter paucivorans TaxID=76009 RepID=A0ABS5PNI9_9FIRM|nr:hypothetical protein [Fusibacter paucivorans]MBS7525617.1 hypothetical protein [Fusibacter paucivorans]
MKKRRLIMAVLLIISSISMMVAFNKTLWAYGDLNLDQSWSYLPNQYASPMDKMPDGLEIVDLKLFTNGLLGSSERIRGTLYKKIELPRTWLGEDLILYNNVFRDNAKIYADGQLVAVQGSFSTMGNKAMVSTIEQYIVIEPMGRDLTLMVLFDGYSDHIGAFDDLYLMPSKQMFGRLNILFGVQTAGFIMTLILLLMVSLKPLPKYQKRSELVFVSLIILRWVSIVSSPIVNQLPISLNFWIRFGAVIQILMLCYALIILFERKEIWKKRLNVMLAVFTFIIIIALLLYEAMNVKWVVLGYAALVTVLYMIFRNEIRATDRFAEMMVVNVCLLADVFYRVKAFSPPMHLFILAVYGVVWHFFNAREMVSNAEEGIHETLPKRIETCDGDETAGIYEEVVDRLNLMAISIFDSKTVFSTRAEAFFGDVLGFRGLHEILLPNDAEQAEYLKEILERIVAAGSLEERIVYLELLPKGIHHGERYLSLEGYWSDRSKCLMLILNDTTEINAKERHALKVRQEMETIIEVLRNQQDFIAFKKNYEQFIQILNEQLHREQCDVIKLMAFVITKLNFFMIKLKLFKIDEGVSRIERIVSDLEMLQAQQKMTALVQFDTLMASYQMSTVLDDVFKWLAPYIRHNDGDYHQRLISVVQLKMLEELIETLPEDETKATLKSQLWRTQHLRFKELVKTYNQYTQDFAKALGKKVRKIEITGDDIYIDYERNDYFTKGCLIILNNAIAHGIESPAERVRRKKSEWGTISVVLKGSASEIMIIVHDDGRGFDVDAIKARMLEAHPDAYDVIKQLSDESVLNHLLEGTYAYKGTADMGLQTLKGEVDSLKGTLRIETEKHAFSRLIITIPNEKAYVF